MIYDILPVNNYRGNNTSTKFDFDFYIENESQLDVFYYDNNDTKTKLSYGVDYSINELKNKNGSYIIFPKETSKYEILKEDETISLVLNLPVSQEIQYTNSSLLNLETLEYSLDYLTRICQILSRQLSRCVKTEESSLLSPDELISKIAEAKILTEKYAKETTEKIHQSDWQETDEKSMAYIKNKPQKLSEFENDKGYLTNEDTGLFATKDGANITDNAKILMSNMAMPSNKYIDLTLGAKRAEYIAPADGIVAFCKTTTAASQFVCIDKMYNNDIIMRASNRETQANKWASVILPVAKGDTFGAEYDAGGDTIWFRFIYTNGSEREVE